MMMPSAVGQRRLARASDKSQIEITKAAMPASPNSTIMPMENHGPGTALMRVVSVLMVLMSRNWQLSGRPSKLLAQGNLPIWATLSKAIANTTQKIPAMNLRKPMNPNAAHANGPAMTDISPNMPGSAWGARLLPISAMR